MRCLWQQTAQYFHRQQQLLIQLTVITKTGHLWCTSRPRTLQVITLRPSTHYGQVNCKWKARLKGSCCLQAHGILIEPIKSNFQVAKNTRSDQKADAAAKARPLPALRDLHGPSAAELIAHIDKQYAPGSFHVQLQHCALQLSWSSSP